MIGILSYIATKLEMVPPERGCRFSNGGNSTLNAASDPFRGGGNSGERVRERHRYIRQQNETPAHLTGSVGPSAAAALSTRRLSWRNTTYQSIC